MKKLIILTITALVLSNALQAQIDVPVTKVKLSDTDRSILSNHMSRYITFSLDKKVLLEKLRHDGYCAFRLNIDGEHDWVVDITTNDMRTSDYKSSYTSESGIFYPDDPYIPNTYKGKTSDGKIVRLTIDDDEFWGVILDSEKHLVIRPTKDYTGNKADNSFILYAKSDVIAQNEYSDFNDALIAPDADNLSNNNISHSATLCTYYLTVAIDADYEFYQDRGSNVTETYSYVFSVLNLIEGVYESTFNLRFIVPFQNVWTTSNDPYSSTDAHILLDQFMAEWNANRTSVSRNIAHLFTGKTLDGGMMGLAWMGQISNSYSYSLSMNRTEMFETTAHEIGHNLNADHPSASNCLCGTATASVMCRGLKDNNLWFCQQSISEISPFLASHSSYLTGNIPNNLTLSGTVTGFNERQARTQITSTQVINSGFTIYKSPTILLSPGFEVKSGAVFTATPLTDCN
ncbi:MAG: M12 family metallo-peptidase [Dysgonamonadaceae bacterium]|jgi:hypothetical protein|nr:M12 family metallo-peptidase [Dysgonamonadaceae bacterium]